MTEKCPHQEQQKTQKTLCSSWGALSAAALQFSARRPARELVHADEPIPTKSESRSCLWFVLAQPREGIALLTVTRQDEAVALCWETIRNSPRWTRGLKSRPQCPGTSEGDTSELHKPNLKHFHHSRPKWLSSLDPVSRSSGAEFSSARTCHVRLAGLGLERKCPGEPWSPHSPPLLLPSRPRAPLARAPQSSPPAVLRAPRALLTPSVQALPPSPAPAVNKEPHPQADWPSPALSFESLAAFSAFAFAALLRLVMAFTPRRPRERLATSVRMRLPRCFNSGGLLCSCSAFVTNLYFSGAGLGSWPRFDQYGNSRSRLNYVKASVSQSGTTCASTTVNSIPQCSWLRKPQPESFGL